MPLYNLLYRAETLSDYLAGVGDEHEALGVHLLAALAKVHRLPPAAGDEHHLAAFMGIGPYSVHHGTAAVQILYDEVAYLIGLCGHNREELAKIYALDNRIHHKGL